MNLLKKLKRIITSRQKQRKSTEQTYIGLPFYNCQEEIVMSYEQSVNNSTQTERIVCPTCECLPEKETLALKQIRINQQLDETTSDAIVLPYYSLVPPFHIFNEKQQQKPKESTIESEQEFSNRKYIGAMSNKKGKAAIKKLYLSVYGTIEYIDQDEDIIIIKPLADYDKDGKAKKPCVSGLELLVAASKLLKEEDAGENEKILGKKTMNDFLGCQLKYLFKGKERLEGIPCSFIEENTACYDEQLNRMSIENMKGKLVVGIIDYCLYDGGKETTVGLHFARILGEEEKKKVTDIVHKYYYG